MPVAAVLSTFSGVRMAAQCGTPTAHEMLTREDDVTDPSVSDATNLAGFEMQRAYRWVRAVVAELTEEQLRWQPNPTTPSIRFHLFHIARWADDLQQVITGADRQLWHAEGVAKHWGLEPSALGLNESGAMIEDSVAMALPFPDREVLFAYCDRVIAAADRALAAIGDEDMHRTTTDEDGESFPLGEAIVGQLSHTARHLGMIECLRGLQGLRGTATV